MPVVCFLTSSHMKWSALVSTRGAVFVVGCWLVVAAAANVAVPQLEQVVHRHARAFMPADAPSSVASAESGALFGGAPDNNLNYAVLERDRPLSEADRQYYHRLVDALDADTGHVRSVTDLWSDPLTASAAVSADQRSAVVMMRLAGSLGTTLAGDSVRAVRDVAERAGSPDGLTVYVTGPGATIADEFAAIDHQMLMITAATIALIALLLLLVYRSVIAAAVPLLSVGVALAVARPIVAALGDAGLIEVSMFSIALVAAMMLGAGTDYAIFLTGRHREGLRRGQQHTEALTAACRGIAPVVVGSALTVAAALSCLGLARVAVFRSTGIPCAIGIVVAMCAALTLTPALMTLTSRRTRTRPPPDRTGRRWRRVGAAVTRWPAPVLVAAIGAIAVLALPALTLRSEWNETTAPPAGADSNRGYAAVDRHFAANQLLPTVVTVAGDHDLRDPAGLIAIERITRALMAIPGVRLVQSASRPSGTVPEQATLSGQAGTIGDQLGSGIDEIVARLNGLGELDAMLAGMNSALSGMRNGLQGSASGLGEVSVAAQDMRRGTETLQRTVDETAGYLDPVRGFVASTPDCANNPLCAVAARMLSPVDAVLTSTAALTAGVDRMGHGSATATGALAGVPAAIDAMSSAVRQARATMADVRGQLTAVGPRLHALTDYLRETSVAFEGSAAGGFYMPERALADPRLKAALEQLISPDGRSTYLMVYGRGEEWGNDGAARTGLIDTAVAEATKEGTLVPTGVYLAGAGPATHDLQTLVHRDTLLLAVATLALIFAIVALLLRSPVAGLVVVGTVAVSFSAALGASVLIWQHLLGAPLHWVVGPISFIALVAVGADYNLLLAMRIKEEWRRSSLRTGVIRAFGATGGVVTTAGLVFGITMLALVASTVTSVAQIGLTVGVGLLIDTLVVRTFVLPSIVVLLGRWFWWPSVRPEHRIGRRAPVVEVDGVAQRPAPQRPVAALGPAEHDVPAEHPVLGHADGFAQDGLTPIGGPTGQAGTQALRPGGE